MFLEIQKNTDFYNEFYIHFLCEFFVVLNYDETNIISRVFFYNVFWMQILVICNNHEFDVKMNGSVNVFDIKIGIVNICMWNANLLLQ